MKRKVFALITGTVLSVCALAGCGVSDNELVNNIGELIEEIAPNENSTDNNGNASGPAPGVLHLHDENNEAFCIDIPADWISPDQTEENGKTVTWLTPGSDPSGENGYVLVSFGRSSDPDIEGYVERWKDRNLEAHPDGIFAEGTTEANGYLYLSFTYVTEDDRLLTDYRILDGNAELRIRQYTDPENEEQTEEITDPENEEQAEKITDQENEIQTTEITDAVMMMVNSAVIYQPAEEKEE